MYALRVYGVVATIYVSFHIVHATSKHPEWYPIIIRAEDLVEPIIDIKTVPYGWGIWCWLWQLSGRYARVGPLPIVLQRACRDSGDVGW